MIRLLEKQDVRVYRVIRREALVTDPDAFGETIEGFDSRTEAELATEIRAKVAVPN